MGLARHWHWQVVGGVLGGRRCRPPPRCSSRQSSPRARLAWRSNIYVLWNIIKFKSWPLEVDIKPLVEDQPNQTFLANRPNTGHKKAMFWCKKIMTLIIFYLLSKADISQTSTEQFLNTSPIIHGMAQCWDVTLGWWMFDKWIGCKNTWRIPTHGEIRGGPLGRAAAPEGQHWPCIILLAFHSFRKFLRQQICFS